MILIESIEEDIIVGVYHQIYSLNL